MSAAATTRSKKRKTNADAKESWKETCTLEELRDVLKKRFGLCTARVPKGCFGNHAPDLYVKHIPAGTEIACYTCTTRCSICHEPATWERHRVVDEKLQCTTCYDLSVKQEKYRRCPSSDHCKRSDLHDGTLHEYDDD